MPLPLQQRAVGPEVRARVCGLLPQEWAVLYREQHLILGPILPCLHQKLSATCGIHQWQVRSAEHLFLCCLCLLDRDAMLQCAQPRMVHHHTAHRSAHILHHQPQQPGGVGAVVLRKQHCLGQEDSPAAASPQGTLTPEPSPLTVAWVQTWRSPPAHPAQFFTQVVASSQLHLAMVAFAIT
ncbi:hypothetical protein CIB84_009548 [Bambusicola thoracicus]|uniref:Uncharacterized protein n=1 Tax=Bambusicola thoracicus TaxID=9083 RepID=A0A2P4SRH4_BAMTH|nr:hypothetical protein CIB84_009548 [Bambusicola thoracicus]